MSFSDYAAGRNAARSARSLRPLFYNPNHPVMSFFIALFAGLGLTVAAWGSVGWLGYGGFDIEPLKKPITYFLCGFPILAGWAGEAFRYRQASRDVSDMMVGADQPQGTQS